MRRAIFIAGLCMVTPIFGEICDEIQLTKPEYVCVKKDGTKAGTEAPKEPVGNLIAPEKAPEKERTIVVKSDCPKPRACRAPRACPIAKPCPTCPSYPPQTVNNYYKAPEQPRRNRINLLMGGTYRALTEYELKDKASEIIYPAFGLQYERDISETASLSVGAFTDKFIFVGGGYSW